jgi:hypothetical protein
VVVKSGGEVHWSVRFFFKQEKEKEKKIHAQIL